MIKKPKTKGKPKFNPLRQIVLAALSETQNLKYADKPKVSRAAYWQWERLMKLYKRLGPITYGKV